MYYFGMCLDLMFATSFDFSGLSVDLDWVAATSAGHAVVVLARVRSDHLRSVVGALRHGHTL